MLFAVRDVEVSGGLPVCVVSGGLRVIIWVVVDMTGAAAMVGGVEEMTDLPVTVDDGGFVLCGGKVLEASASQENKNQAKGNVTVPVPTSLKGAVQCGIFPPNNQPHDDRYPAGVSCQAFPSLHF